MHVEAERLRLEELMEQLVLEMETVMRQRDEEVASMRQSHVTQAQQIQEACGQEVACKLRALEAMLELRNSELARSRQHEAALADKVGARHARGPSQSHASAQRGPLFRDISRYSGGCAVT